MSPLRLTTDESAALVLGLRALQQLPDMDAALIASLLAKLGVEDEPMAVEVSPSAGISAFTQAIRDGRDVQLRYVHPVRDDVTERRVTPIRVVTRDGIDYFYGYCHTAGALRTFRVDRMASMTDTGA